MKRRLKISLALASAILGLVIVLYLTPANWLVSSHLGMIEHAGNSTRLMLRKYELTGFPYEIRRWLTGNHDGAVGQEIAYVFIPWGVQHPDEFTRIVEGIEQENQPRFVNWLGGMVGETAIESEFLQAFHYYETPVINKLKLEVEKRKKWRQP